MTCWLQVNLAAPRVSAEDIRSALAANIRRWSCRWYSRRTAEFRRNARAVRIRTLAEAGTVPALVTKADVRPLQLACTHVFFETYSEPSAEVTEAAEKALEQIELKVGLNQTLDLTLDAISLASIYFLAAIGLAITFGVMGVINMAHGEFIMMGAYTGYVVQQFIPDHTLVDHGCYSNGFCWSPSRWASLWSGW